MCKSTWQKTSVVVLSAVFLSSCLDTGPSAGNFVNSTSEQEFAYSFDPQTNACDPFDPSDPDTSSKGLLARVSHSESAYDTIYEYLDNADVTKFEHSYTIDAGEETLDGGIVLRLIRLNAAGERLIVGAAWLSTAQPPENWPQI